MADEFETLVILIRQNAQMHVLLQVTGSVNQFAVDLTAQSCLGKPWPDICGDLCHGYGMVKLAYASVRQGYRWHIERTE